MTERQKSVLVMLVVFLTLLPLLEFFSFATLRMWDFLKHSDVRSEAMDPFNSSEEQRNFFSEVLDYKSYTYKAFVEWKNTEFKGKHLTIDSYGRRVTGHESKYHQAPTIRFFGGSTTWGFGVADESTIPALIGSKDKLNTVNYAEQAYNSRQSLNSLIENISDIHKGDVIIFYDGVNDIANCFAENSTNGHTREGYIKEALRKMRMLENDPIPSGISLIGKGIWFYYTRTNTYNLIVRAKRKLLGNESQIGTKEDLSVCGDQSKAEEVAEFLFKSWETGEILAKGIGAQFACVLQPTPYTSNFSPHFYNERTAQSVKNVYPLVREKAKNLDCFVDLSQSLKKDYYFDDCCHVNRMGNEEIADLLHASVILPKFGRGKTLEAHATIRTVGIGSRPKNRNHSQQKQTSSLVHPMLPDKAPCLSTKGTACNPVTSSSTPLSTSIVKHSILVP